jgi:DNA-binding response OmpR family regulator
MLKILLLEDDTILSETLCELLESENFHVDHVKDGKAALDATFHNTYDLLLLDVNVSFLNGFELLQMLREADDTTPAIFITALGDIASLSHGFSVGADDYIKKPFDFDELLVRIHAIIRKSYKSHTQKLHVGAFSFEIEKEELYKEDAFVPLSPYELKITKLLFQNRDKTVKKEHILETLHEGSEVSEGALRVHITKLRKIGLPITTIKGIGYRLAQP